MSQIEFLEFSMKKQAPSAGADWFTIVEDKKNNGPAKVYIYDEIGYWGTTAKDFAAQLGEIDATEIHLHINSPGGSVFDGLAIGAAIKEHKATVIGKVDGMAASAASFILQYCDTREISRNAQVMIHDAKAYAGGNAEQMRKAAELLDRVSNNIADIYAVRSGQGTVESWRAVMVSGDTWYSGNEALEAGLVDTVTDNPEEEDDAPEESTKNSWTQEEIENFLVLPAAQLAKDAGRSVITNRVEEAHMSGANPQNQQTPPSPPQPPAPAAATQTFLVNGAEVTDFSAVQQHINGLEAFKQTTLKNAREDFVKGLAAGPTPKIAATQIESLTEFADSLNEEQYNKWKASWDAAPASSLFQNHGTGPENEKSPASVQAMADDERISVLQGIVEANRATMTEEQVQSKDSYKELQTLLEKKAAASAS